MLRNQTKRFHFIEMDFMVYFPKSGNRGKYLGYNVTIIDRKAGVAQHEKQVKLKEIFENPEFEKRYPHTVGYYRETIGKDGEFKPEYLEIRRISTIEEFWLFLNALDI